MTPSDLGLAIFTDCVIGAAIIAVFMQVRKWAALQSVFWPVALQESNHGTQSLPTHTVTTDAVGDGEPLLLRARPGRRESFIEWLRNLNSITEDELLQAAGLDSVAFIRMHKFGLQLFSFLSLFAMPFLLPLNFKGALKGTYNVDTPVNFPEKEWDLR
eukprot:1195932-Prorocentrum_minimum.AAC.5